MAESDVLGNHEYYRRCLPDELIQARRVAPIYGVNLLENDTVVLDGVRFIGCTLWTDYAIFGGANISRTMLPMGSTITAGSPGPSSRNGTASVPPRR